MLPCISAETMRESDRLVIEGGVPGVVLMHRAAVGVFRAHPPKARAAIFCGSGNNGGDGFALAAILKERGFDAVCFAVSNRRSPDAAHYEREALRRGALVLPFDEGADLSGFDTVYDCLLGTGFHGAPEGAYAAAIGAINRAARFVVSVDINSGLSGDTGEMVCAVKSDLTVTIGALKNGLMKAPDGLVGALAVAEIGIPPCREENFVLTADDGEPARKAGAVYFEYPGEIPVITVRDDD